MCQHPDKPINANTALLKLEVGLPISFASSVSRNVCKKRQNFQLSDKEMLAK